MKNWRLNLVLVLICALAAAVIWRLIFLQILKHDFYEALAQGQQNIFEPILGSRGEVFFSDKEKLIPLALNLNFEFCYLVPQEVLPEKEAETAKTLSQILDLKENSILEKLKDKESLFVRLKDRLSEQEVSQLREANLAGVYHKKELIRYYPQGSLASHVIGFVGAEAEGNYGVEAFYDEILRGKEAFQKAEKGLLGYFSLPEAEEVSGQDLVLGLDYNIQFQAEKLLEEAKQRFDIESGQILVLEPRTGQIIALAGWPNFDPNKYWQWSGQMDIFKNKAIQEIFEPGSVFKPIVMAAGLNEGKITPETTYVDPGQVKITGYTIYNYEQRSWGQRTMTEVLEKSINTGAVFAEKQVGHELFVKYIERFGIFEPTGIDLAGEVYSENKEFLKGYEINFATAAFGQGIEMTPLQLARAFGTIANAGELPQLHLLKEEQNNLEAKRVISQETATKLTEMLVSVVENGFAKRAQVPGYYIAGKTGTAQVPREDIRGYYENRTRQTFVGFGPAFNPRFLVLVKLDNPKTKTAEYSAVPIFQEMAKYIIDYWQIPPDYE